MASSLQDQADSQMVDGDSASLAEQLAFENSGGAAEDQGGSETPNIADQAGTGEDPGKQNVSFDAEPEPAGEDNPPNFNLDDIHSKPPQPQSQDAGSQGAGSEQSQNQGGGEVTDDLVAAAAQYGISEQNAKQYTGDQLRGLLIDMDRQILAQYQQQQQYGAQQQQQPFQQQQQQQQFQAAAQQNQQQVADGNTGQQTNDEDLVPFEIDDTVIDSGAKEVLDGLQQHYIEMLKQERQRRSQIEQRLSGAEQAANALMQQQQQAAVNDFMTKFDSAISGLEDFKDVLGDGASFQLPAQSIYGMNRQRVLETASVLLNAHSQQGRNVDVNTAVRNAVQLVFPDKMKQSIQREVKGQLRNRQGQFVARPTQRQTEKPATGESRALQRADQWAKEKGLFVGEIGGDTEDTL